MKRFYFLLLLLVVQITAWAQSFIFQQFPEKYASQQNIHLFKVYHNPIKFVVEGVPCANLRLTGKGFEIRKDTNNIFYIRQVDTPYAQFLKLYNKDSLLDKIRVTVDANFPLPDYNFYHFDLLNHFWYVFDSIGLYMPQSVNNITCMNCDYSIADVFKVQNFTIEIISHDKIIYSEYIKGNKYTKLAKKNLWANCAAHRYLCSPSTQVRIRELTIKDDLSNVYVLPHHIVDVR